MKIGLSLSLCIIQPRLTHQMRPITNNVPWIDIPMTPDFGGIR